MEEYDPMERLAAELERSQAIKVLELVYKYLSAGRKADYISVIREIQSILAGEDQPIDPVEYILRRIIQESFTRVHILQGMEEWAQSAGGTAVPTYIEPRGWLITLDHSGPIKNAHFLNTEWENDPYEEEKAVLRIANSEGPELELFEVNPSIDLTM